MPEQKRSRDPEGSARYFYIDWLRIFAVLLLFPFHTARIFDPWPWYVKSETLIPGLKILVGFVGLWHMHLFFFLAGASTCLAMRSRSPGQYIRERRRRLLIPLISGILIVVPPQCYYRLFGNPGLVWPHNMLRFFTGGPQYQKSFVAFYPDFFNGVFPTGNFEWGHLWFLAYLFVFSLLSLPLFQYLKSDAAGRFGAALTNFLQKPAAALSLFIPIAVIESSLRGLYPQGNQNLIGDWANFLTYETFFIYGFLFFHSPENIRGLVKSWRLLLALGLVSSLGCSAFQHPHLFTQPLRPYSKFWVAATVLGAFSTWCWVAGFIGLGKTFLDFGGKILQYSSAAALPVYILHQTVIVIVGFYVLKIGLGLRPAYVMILLGSFVATILLYEVLRHNRIARFFLGIKSGVFSTGTSPDKTVKTAKIYNRL